MPLGLSPRYHRMLSVESLVDAETVETMNLSEATVNTLVAAAARRKIGPTELALRILETVAFDNMIDAVLDDGA